MKIYTKKGDSGTTGTYGKEILSKADRIIHVNGELDELCASIGYSASQVGYGPLYSQLCKIQGDLFKIGSQISVVASKTKRELPSVLVQEDVQNLENLIDGYNSELTELKFFILPGGHPAAASLHLTRAVCRRSERSIVSCFFSPTEGLEEVIPYLNRLSDLLFVLARWVNFKNSVVEPIWNPKLDGT